MLDGLITLIDEGGVEWDDKRLGRHLKLRDLNVLLTVARCGSMGKAAAELALSQPAVSKAIADMEFTLGVVFSTAVRKASSRRFMLAPFSIAG